MNNNIKILAFAGSTRKDSFNKMLLKNAINGVDGKSAEVTYIDLRDYQLPIYDGDYEIEKGIPENGIKLKELLRNHDGLMIASPEYNSSISAVLKNTIDWISRPEEGRTHLDCFDGKTAALMSASPGALGGLRGLAALRSILGNIKVIALPDQIAIPGADKAFDQNGILIDDIQRKAVEGLGEKLVDITSKLKNQS